MCFGVFFLLSFFILFSTLLFLLRSLDFARLSRKTVFDTSQMQNTFVNSVTVGTI